MLFLSLLRPWIGLFDESTSFNYDVLIFHLEPCNVLLLPTKSKKL